MKITIDTENIDKLSNKFSIHACEWNETHGVLTVSEDPVATPGDDLDDVEPDGVFNALCVIVPIRLPVKSPKLRSPTEKDLK